MEAMNGYSSLCLILIANIEINIRIIIEYIQYTLICLNKLQRIFHNGDDMR